MRRHLMVSERIFSCTCTDIWCYTNRLSLVLAETLEVIRSSLVLCTLAQTLGATLKDLPAILRRHLMLRYRVLGYRGGGPYRLGGGTGPQAGTTYTYICIYIYIFIYIYLI